MSGSASSAAGIQRRAWIAWSAVCLIWGTTYLAIKIGLDTIPPFLMGGLRYVAAGLLLAGILAARGKRLPPLATWGRLAVIGFFMLTVGNSGVVWGEQFVPSGITAVLIGTTPLWMVSVEAMVSSRVTLSAAQWVGIILGFAGIVVLIWPDLAFHPAETGGRNFVFGVIGVQAACIGWSIGSAYTRRHVLPADVFGSAALQMIFGGTFMLLIGTAAGEWSRISLTPHTFGALAYLTLAGSVIAFAAYSYALRHLDVAVVSLYTYINPVIAVALGTLVLGEPFHLRMLAAAAIIVVGILTVKRG